MKTNNDELENRIIVPIEETEDDICRVLWLSVILQNLSDALYTSDVYPFNNRRADALKWFKAQEGEGSDFCIVCNLAGVDFQATRKRIGMFLSGEIEAIDFRCFRKGNLAKEPAQDRTVFFKRLAKRKEKEQVQKMKRISPAHFKKAARITVAANENIPSTPVRYLNQAS